NHKVFAVLPRIASWVDWSRPNSWVKSLRCCAYVTLGHQSSQGKLLPQAHRSGPHARITRRKGSCRSRKGYSWADPVGRNESLVKTFGQLASLNNAARILSRSGPTFRLRLWSSATRTLGKRPSIASTSATAG